MNTNKKWHDKYFVVPMNKFASLRIIKSISGGIASGVNVLLIGSILSIISIVMSFIPGLKETDFVEKFTAMKDLVFGIVGIFFAYSIAASNAKYNKIDQQSAGFIAIIAYFILMKPQLAVGESGSVVFTSIFSKFGTSGISVAIVSGIGAGEVAYFFKKRGLVLDSSGLPEIIQTWFDYIIAGTVVTLSAWIVSYILSIDLFTILGQLVVPIMDMVTSFWGTLILVASGPLLFYFGIHPLSVITPIFVVTMEAAVYNAELFAQGLSPVVANGFIINSYATMLMINLGGAGSTLGLNFALLFSRSKTHRKLGQLAILPSILNINEPLIFGLPIMLNPAFFFPFFIVPMINQVITYIVLYLGWVDIPSSLAFSMHIPTPINAYILSEDYRAVILIFLLIVIDTLIWVPFLKTHANQLEKQETIKRS